MKFRKEPGRESCSKHSPWPQLSCVCGCRVTKQPWAAQAGQGEGEHSNSKLGHSHVPKEQLEMKTWESRHAGLEMMSSGLLMTCCSPCCAWRTRALQTSQGLSPGAGGEQWRSRAVQPSVRSPPQCSFQWLRSFLIPPGTPSPSSLAMIPLSLLSPFPSASLLAPGTHPWLVLSFPDKAGSGV